jgi:DNA replication protein DnaC
MNIVPLPVPEPDPFDDFWLLYPRHVAKKDARRAWAKIPPALHNNILLACVEWRVIWSAKDPEYLPHPATWLNGERWEDELPRTPASSSASHRAAALPADSPRSSMPESVRAALAAIRGRK